MIPFGSQRGGGSELATHLSNAEDNEYVEVAEIRGAIADDLHGAYAEWEAQAHATTKAKNYLYSLSINPDPAQGRLSREQYEDYIERTETSLGLAGQPRSIVYHIKESKDGELREHCHVVWSRIDGQECRAIPIAYDKFKLMAVTRGFAHDHGLSLPQGYETRRAKAAQLSLYEKVQQDHSDITREERMELVTDLWRRSDSAKAFVAGLEENGYLLANGRRPYVLIDLYGNMNALPKLIDDRTVKTKDVRAFLEKDFPPESLPSVEDAKALAKAHLQERKTLKQNEAQQQEREFLLRSQEKRREQHRLETEKEKALAERERTELKARHDQELAEKRRTQVQENFRVEFQRAQNAPTGLKGFLAKVSGFSFVQAQLHKFEDQKRQLKHKEELRECLAKLDAEWREREHLYRLRMYEFERKRVAQEKRFERETQSLALKHQRSSERAWRQTYEHMPSVNLALTPGGRRAAPHLAKNRFTAPTAKEINRKAQARDGIESKPIDLVRDFRVAASPEKKSRSGESKSPQTSFEGNPKDRGGRRR